MPTKQPSYIEQVMMLAVQSKASDVHFAVGFPPFFRISRWLGPSSIEQPVTHEIIMDGIKQMLLPETYAQFEKRGDFDFSFTFPSAGRFRFAIYWKSGEPAIAARFIPSVIPTLEDLEVPEAAFDFVELHEGLVLVTGPTGAGKSTLLASMIDDINANQAKHIVTLEDPIEFIHKPQQSLISQRELGVDFPSFAEGLRHCFRQDPNVVLIGELRDQETISTALTLAETGHLIFATLHTGSAVQTIDRIVSSFPASQQPQIRLQLSFVLRGCISQILVPSADRRLTAVREVMVGNVAVANVIREGRTDQLQNIIYSSSQEKMVDLDRDLQNLLAEGRISQEVAYEHARNKSLI